MIRAPTSRSVRSMSPPTLPDDLLHTIFRFLNHSSLSACGSVCRQWRSVSLHEDFWSFLSFSGKHVTEERIEAACARHPKVADLHLLLIPQLVAVLGTALTHLKHLKMLTIMHENNVAWSELAETLKDFEHSLEDLVICDVRQEEVENDNDERGSHGSKYPLRYPQKPIKLECKRLRNVRIIGCPLLGMLSFTCPLLETLSLELVGMQSLHLDCPKLKSLQLSSCPCITTIIGWSGISELHISDCPVFTFDLHYSSSLKKLSLNSCRLRLRSIQRCTTLQSLSISRCYGWMGASNSIRLNLPHLQSFTMEECRDVKELVMSGDGLTDMDISHCTILENIHVTSPVLTNLVLYGELSLTTLSFDGSSLRHMDLFNCSALSCLRLSHSPLEYLRLANCSSIHSLSLKLLRLQRFCIYGCDKLVEVELELHRLPLLELGACHYVDDLKINAGHVTSLSLAGCGRISHVDIFCPELLSLNTFGCTLEKDFFRRVTESCRRIRNLNLNSCSSLRTADLWMLKNLPCLAELDVSYTNITNIFFILRICPALKILKLAGCQHIDYGTLDAEMARTQVEELDVSYGNIGESALGWLLGCFTKLTKLNINGCANVRILDGENVEWQAPMTWGALGKTQKSIRVSPRFEIRALNCVGCPNLVKVALTDKSGFGKLESVNLSYCCNLTRLRLECSMLTSLNLRDCISLVERCIRCPRLAT